MDQKFKDGRWSRRIDVADFVYNNITPYEGDASFLQGPTERTKKLWAKCVEALAEERANGGVRSIDAKTISTITSHAAGYIDRDNELIGVFRQTNFSREPSSLSEVSRWWRRLASRTEWSLILR